MTKKISQREARMLKKRVEQLESNNRANRNAWNREYVGGVHIDSLTIPEVSLAKSMIAKKLGHPVVVTVDGDNTIRFYAVN